MKAVRLFRYRGRLHTSVKLDDLKACTPWITGWVPVPRERIGSCHICRRIGGV